MLEKDIILAFDPKNLNGTPILGEAVYCQATGEMCTRACGNYASSFRTATRSPEKIKEAIATRVDLQGTITEYLLNGEADEEVDQAIAQTILSDSQHRITEVQRLEAASCRRYTVNACEALKRKNV